MNTAYAMAKQATSRPDRTCLWVTVDEARAFHDLKRKTGLHPRVFMARLIRLGREHVDALVQVQESVEIPDKRFRARAG